MYSDLTVIYFWLEHVSICFCFLYKVQFPMMLDFVYYFTCRNLNKTRDIVCLFVWIIKTVKIIIMRLSYIYKIPRIKFYVCFIYREMNRYCIGIALSVQYFLLCFYCYLTGRKLVTWIYVTYNTYISSFFNWKTFYLFAI